MVLKLFGLKRKEKAAKSGEPLVEFQELPPEEPASPSVRATPDLLPEPEAPGKRSSKLTPKQRAQRKYAAGMKQVRARAKTAKGGKGRIAKRSGATKLRRDLGLKPGKGAKKAKASKKKR